MDQKKEIARQIEFGCIENDLRLKWTKRTDDKGSISVEKAPWGEMLCVVFWYENEICASKNELSAGAAAKDVLKWIESNGDFEL